MQDEQPLEQERRVYLNAQHGVVEFVYYRTWGRRTEYRNPTRESLARLSAVIRDWVERGKVELVAYSWGWCAVEWASQ